MPLSNIGIINFIIDYMDQSDKNTGKEVQHSF